MLVYFRIVPLTVVGALLLSGCDSSAKTFGKTYDECLLKNAAQAAATDICARHFERLRTFEEQDSNMLTADGQIVDSGNGSKIIATITNNSLDKIAVSYNVFAAFWADESYIPESKIQRTIGPIQYGSPYSEKEHREMIQPGQTVTLELSMPENAQYAQAFTVDATIRQLVPMRGE